MSASDQRQRDAEARRNVRGAIPDTDPWTLYWRADNQDSCVAAATPRDAEALSQIWQRFAARLTAGARVLDLATGNGTVALALLRGNGSLRITGVDKADIDPLRFLSSPGPLHAVQFAGAIDICSLPFEPGSFDVLTSQFGIEYAPLAEAVRSAAAVLRSGGRLNFLMHHAESEIVAPTRAKMREMAGLLQAGGVLERLLSYVNGEAGIDALDAAGKQHLDSGAGRSSQITGRIFEGVNRVTHSMQQGNRRAGGELAAGMVSRLRADHDRLMQLNDAALTELQAQQARDQLEKANIAISVMRPLLIHEDTRDAALMAWQLCGEKR